MLKRCILPTLCATFMTGIAPSPALASEVSYRKDIKPLWEQQCSSCHGMKSPTLGQFKQDSERYEAANLGPRMASYAELTSFVVWPETGALMRRLDDGRTSGKAGNMYQHLGENEQERQANLASFRAWLGTEEDWFHNRWNARGEIPAVTKEQISRLKLAD